eukprot:6262790-Amphidinium_carterae.2
MVPIFRGHFAIFKFTALGRHCSFYVIHFTQFCQILLFKTRNIRKQCVFHQFQWLFGFSFPARADPTAKNIFSANIAHMLDRNMLRPPGHVFVERVLGLWTRFSLWCIFVLQTLGVNMAMLGTGKNKHSRAGEL